MCSLHHYMNGTFQELMLHSLAWLSLFGGHICRANNSLRFSVVSLVMDSVIPHRKGNPVWYAGRINGSECVVQRINLEFPCRDVSFAYFARLIINGREHLANPLIQSFIVGRDICGF